MINCYIIYVLMVVEGLFDINKFCKIICEWFVYGEDEKGEWICLRLM